jgi:alkanesulfonate monooxygenase SsuD/methylene tetrahydromethanopterin reductase-like flavin-dependent oxidoreductase (luciferase family)
MNYGVLVPITGVNGDVHKVIECARLAEEAGWDGVFIEDYILYFGEGAAPIYDPWTVIAAVAVSTRRIRLGITITPLARRRPWKVAREAVTIDHLSNGRLILGFALGDSRDKSISHFGEETDGRKRAEMLDEALEILVGLWGGRPFSYDGKYYKVGEVEFLPRPVQSSRIPIWIGGGWPRKGVVERIARWDGACPYRVKEDGTGAEMSPDDLREMRQFVEGQRADSSTFDIVCGGATSGKNINKARAKVAPLAEAGATWWVEFTSSSAKPLRDRIKQGPPRLE